MEVKKALMEKKQCDSKVITSHTLPECFNVPLNPEGKSGPLVVKIPVVIAETNIQIDVEAEIKLEEPALDIKRIKKNLFLTQCKLITIDEEKFEKNMKDGKEEKFDHKRKFGKLFLKGFIRKNIEYSTLNNSCFTNGCISGDIKHSTCNIPFECVTKIEFDNPPEIKGSGFSTEVETFGAKFNSCEPCAHTIMGRDPCEQEFRHFEVFSEKVFCELESVKIFEADIHEKGMSSVDYYKNEHTFDSFTEKMVIFLRLKLLQNQQVKISHSQFPHQIDKAPPDDDYVLKF